MPANDYLTLTDYLSLYTSTKQLYDLELINQDTYREIVLGLNANALQQGVPFKGDTDYVSYVDFSTPLTDFDDSEEEEDTSDTFDNYDDDSDDSGDSWG